MSNVITQIHNALLSEIASTVPADFKKLQFIYDVEMNTSRGIFQGYGVRLLSSASAAEQISKFYTLDQTFEIILTSTAGRQSDDEDLIAKILALHDVIDDIYIQIFLKKLGLPGIILLVSNPAITEPEFFDANGFIVLRATIDIRYRKQISL